MLELHGSVKRNYCEQCRKFYDDSFILGSAGIPACECGGTVKPDVVLYEEGLDRDTMQQAVMYISRADMLIVGGTSLVVYPAAGMIDYFRGTSLVLINRAATAADRKARLLIQDSIGEVLGQISVN